MIEQENMERSKVTRPILRYHGGKWKLAPWIIANMPPHRGYIEPFGGGASVLLRKARSYAEVYNDLDGEVVNVFRVVRDRGEDILRALRLTPFAREEFIEAWEPSTDNVEQCRRTIIRKRTEVLWFNPAAWQGRAQGSLALEAY